MNNNEDTRTRLIQRSDLPWGREQPHDEQTLKLPSLKPEHGETDVAGSADNRTILVGLPVTAGPVRTEKKNPMDDPVAGWLAIISGPGRGGAVNVGYQINSIGREPGNRILLDFGDQSISGQNHAEIIYDPKNRKFYAGRTGGSNLTYVNNNPLLQTQELTAGDVIQIGITHLRFIPLCGQDFDWMTPIDEETAKTPV